MASVEAFKTKYDEKQTELKTLRNNKGTVVSITNFGARVVEWIFDGVDVVVGFESIDAYLSSTEFYYGATIGRFANRIAGGRFSLEGKEYQLEINNAPNHLHGGTKGFHNRVWEIENATVNSVQLSYLSKDGEEGFPGNLSVLLTYTLTEKDELLIDYKAETDSTTILNLTHHSFFNLNGGGSILNHTLQINADHFTPVNQNLVPVGQIARLDGSPLDFRIAKKIGDDIDAQDEQLVFGKGFDHNYVLRTTPGVFAARAVGDRTGIALEVYTNQPGLQFYSGNFMAGKNTIKGNRKDEFRNAFCLETQHFPDSPNQPGFPSTVLHAGEVFISNTVYKLTAE